MKIIKAVESLACWYRKRKRALPWRSRPTLYRVWISEIMLQQTQVISVVPYFDRFMKTFPNLESLIQATEQDVLNQWSGLGYYSRARNIFKAAKKLDLFIRENGAWPETKDQWLELPGVGPYTAGAILSIALNQPVPILDGNIERVLSRFYCIDRPKSASKTARHKPKRVLTFKEALWKKSGLWIKASLKTQVTPSELNQGLMELGALLCTFRQPRCQICPLKDGCQAFKMGKTDDYPPKKEKKVWKTVHEIVECLVASQSKIYVVQRGSQDWCAGLWDFPKLNLKPSQKSKLPRVSYIVTNHKVTRFLKVVLLPNKNEKWPSDKGKWIDLSEIQSTPVGAAFVKSISRMTQSGIFLERNVSNGV